MGSIAGCTSSTCLDAGTTSILFVVVIGFFALGYSIGQSVLWVRRILEVV